MKHIYRLTYQFIVRFLIISMFLQSCGGFSSLPNPIQEQTIEKNQELTKQLTIKHIVDKEFIAEGNHLVTFREEAGQLVADVEVNVPAGFSKSYEGVAVNMDERDTNLMQLPHMGQAAQKCFIHFNPPKNDQPAYIYVGDIGLKGGGNTISLSRGDDYYSEENYTKAIKYYKKAANHGSAHAKYNLGMMYAGGKGVVQSDQEAFKWFKEAADQGNAAAQNSLGFMYWSGKGVVKDYAKAKEWYEKAAEQGNAEAQSNLGEIYEYGWGEKSDYQEAVKCYKRSTKHGSIFDKANFGKANLARMYYHGTGIEKNITRARELFLEAIATIRNNAEEGQAGAQYLLGWKYQYLEEDFRQAVEWYQKAADQNEPVAQYSLGQMYEHGWGVTKDERQAVEWYQKAADQGLATARNNLTALYAKGVADSGQEVVKWYEKAAEQGDAHAQFNLGLMYASGQGVEQDYAKAKEWYEKAANQGNAIAQNNLGLMYEYGNGVAQSDLEAAKWYQKAADQGLTIAQNNFERVMKDNYLLEAYLTDFHFNANIDDVFTSQGKVDYIGKDTFVVDKDTVGSTVTRSFSKEIQKSFSWCLGKSLGGSIKANYSVGIPLLGGVKGEVSGNTSLTATQTWTTSEKHTIQVMDILNPKREGVYEMSAIVYMLDNVTIPFTAYAKLTAVSKNTPARPFTTPIVKRLYQINGCTYDLGCPVQQDDKSLKVKIEGEMTGTYDVKSFTSVRRLGDLDNNSIPERKESQNQML